MWKKILMVLGVLTLTCIFIIMVLLVIGIFAGSDKDKDQVISESQTISLAQDTMKGFSLALQKGDFSDFYNNVAGALRDKYTLQIFNDTFLMFNRYPVDWTELERYKPLIDGEAVVDEDGYLVINGRYPTKPQNITFDLKYIKENDEWKLGLIFVEVEPLKESGQPQQTSPAREMPSEAPQQPPLEPSEGKFKLKRLDNPLALLQGAQTQSSQTVYQQPGTGSSAAQTFSGPGLGYSIEIPPEWEEKIIGKNPNSLQEFQKKGDSNHAVALTYQPSARQLSYEEMETVINALAEGEVMLSTFLGFRRMSDTGYNAVEATYNGSSQGMQMKSVVKVISTANSVYILIGAMPLDSPLADWNNITGVINSFKP